MVFLATGGVRDFQAVILVQRDDELQASTESQPQAARPEERLVVANFFRGDLEHEVPDQHGFDLRGKW